MLNNKASSTKYYITQTKTGRLLHGIAGMSGRYMTPVAVWKNKGDFAMARRFSSVENAVRFARHYKLAYYSVIDMAGREQYVYNDIEEAL